MRYKFEVFNNYSELMTFLNKNRIKVNMIACINESKNGITLIYFGQ